MKKWKISIGIFILFAMFLCFVTSCKKPSKNKRQTLHLNFQEGDVPSVHPHLLQGHMRGRILGKALFEGLTRINAKGEVELAGAESFEISPSQTQYTFKLRENKWSDGALVTAFQYEKAWKRALSHKADCPRADLFYVIKGSLHKTLS